MCPLDALNEEYEKKDNPIREEQKRTILIYRRESGVLFLDYGGRKVEVHIKQCFPWSHPGKYLSLRDLDDNEVCLIEDMQDLDPISIEILSKELEYSQFVLNVLSISSIEEDVELRRYLVMTPQGQRLFQTKLEDWPEILEDGTILIEDLAGDLFKIDNWKQLDKRSREELAPYVS